MKILRILYKMGKLSVKISIIELMYAMGYLMIKLKYAIKRLELGTVWAITALGFTIKILILQLLLLTKRGEK